MFAPRKMPLKEGRSHPGLPNGGPFANGRGRFSPRQIGLIVLVLICIPIFYYIHSSGGDGLSAYGGASSRSKSPADAVLPKDKSADSPKAEAADGFPKLDVDATEKHKYQSTEERDGVSSPAASADAPKKSTVEDNDDDEVPKKPASRAPLKTSGSEVWSDRPQFEKALEKVIRMLPDEVHMRELIREVESTGKERLREMGLRTRQYRKYFEAWEALHMTEDEEGGTYIRDDVLQYLRSHVHTAAGNGEVSAYGALAEMSLGQTIRSYEAYRSFLQKFAQLLFPWTMPYFSDHMSLHAHFKKGGRGIVLTAGDDQAPYLLTTIVTFRNLGCDLPIEVMYLGDSDLGEDYRSELDALDGVVTRDIAQMVNDEGWRLAGWAAKPFAILLSSFREAIFIDADSLFFRNPALLFEEPGYKKTGALFFKDRKIMPENKKRWLQQVLPKPIPKLAKQTRFWTGESGHMQESGVVVVDKWQHFVPLLLVTRMNGPDRDGNKDKGRVGVYDMVYGDKETFWLGWLLAGDERYHFHEGDAGIMGVLKEPEDLKKEIKKSDLDPEQQAAINEDLENQEVQLEDGKPDNYTICAPQLLHLDTDGKPLWFNGWILANKFAERSKKTFADFQHYLVEPRDVRDPGAWQLAESNMCCLTTDNDKMFTFEQKDKDVLEMIMARAKEIGAYGNQR